MAELGIKDGELLLSKTGELLDGCCCGCLCCLDRVTIIRPDIVQNITCVPVAGRPASSLGVQPGCYQQTFLLTKQRASEGLCCFSGRWIGAPTTCQPDIDANFGGSCAIGHQTCGNAYSGQIFENHWGLMCLGFDNEVTLCYAPGGKLRRLRIWQRNYIRAFVQFEDFGIGPVPGPPDAGTVRYIDDVVGESEWIWSDLDIPADCSSVIELGSPTSETLMQQRTFTWGRPYRACGGGSSFSYTHPGACHASAVRLSSSGGQNHDCGTASTNGSVPLCSNC